jgi:hypothetical protein
MVIALVLAAGCSAAPASPELPACAKASAALSTLPALPPEFPIPPGTRLTATEESGGITTVAGYVPSDLRSAATFLQTHLPPAGYRLGLGDSEPDEAESDFSGRGVSGRWKVHGILDCASAVTLTISYHR